MALTSNMKRTGAAAHGMNSYNSMIMRCNEMLLEIESILGRAEGYAIGKSIFAQFPTWQQREEALDAKIVELTTCTCNPRIDPCPACKRSNQTSGDEPLEF